MARFCDSNQKRGLTLVELIVVLVILAVLAVLLVPSLTGYIDKAVEKRVMLQARSLMTAAQATIDEAYAKGELHIDNYGGFKQPNEDTAHKLAKQIIELSELDTQCQWQFSLADADADFPTGKIAILQFCNGKHYIVYRITAGRPAKRNPAGWSRVQKATSLPTWSPPATACFSLNPLTISLIHIIHSWAKPDRLVLYQQTAIKDLESLF